MTVLKGGFSGMVKERKKLMITEHEYKHVVFPNQENKQLSKILFFYNLLLR